MSEEQLQSRCILWFWNTYIEHRRMLFHVDNNSWNAVIGAKKKALGVVSGPSDLVLVALGKVIFIEMKTDVGVQNPAQKEFEAGVTSRGHRYEIIRTEQKFKELIWSILGKR